nr:glycosyltransferase family 2 protein [candidate division KSB1 bacterium]NIR68887.1 glycosyltransferase family 2 protein [candidate division KSB1 bacterium]NIS27254.1 glycosyltransferase family 2 protein [candidate division KSB1 bacterium]NIT74139.1 glycosyltransferase family 2 protein [candidate division KSB1 bacterium]NIU27988.1 glycosyltransferase family 2 protein [candidate division KSB1 bacterium]
MNPILILLGGLAILRSLASLIDSVRYRKTAENALEEAYPHFAPKVSLIVPCKGIDPGFDDNIRSLLNQDYQHFEIIFVTETTDDPAYSRLKDILSRINRSASKLVTAGVTDKCAQKIHNLLHAVQKANAEAEVLVFADSDIRVHGSWLRHLVRPLQDQRVGATTGYRWYMPIKGNFWSLVRSVWNMTSANVLFSNKYNFAWGGSMAIRKDTFEALHIARKWQTGLSDDMILSQAVKAGGYGIKFVPQSIVATYEKTSWRSLLEWTSRQLTIVRMYEPKLWKFAAFPQWLFNFIFLLGFYLVMKGWLTNTAIPVAVWLMMSDLP